MWQVLSFLPHTAFTRAVLRASWTGIHAHVHVMIHLTEEIIQLSLLVFVGNERFFVWQTTVAYSLFGCRTFFVAHACTMWYFLASDGYSVYYVLTIYGIPGMWHVFSMCYLSDLAGTVNSKTSVRFIYYGLTWCMDTSIITLVHVQTKWWYM